MKRAVPTVFLAVLFAFASVAAGQEVLSIDLTAAQQRVALRYPPPVPEKSGNGITGQTGEVGETLGDCAPDIRDPHAAAVYLDSMDGKEIDPKKPFQVEFRFVNSGRLPINIPVSPNLSDLQPSDPSVPFSYLSLALAVRVRNDAGSTAYVQLYGSVNHKGTTQVLKPGEWIRVKADLKLNPPPRSCISLTLVPGFWIDSTRHSATSKGYWEASDGVCINQNPITPPSVTVMCEQPHDSGSR